MPDGSLQTSIEGRENVRLAFFVFVSNSKVENPIPPAVGSRFDCRKAARFALVVRQDFQSLSHLELTSLGRKPPPSRQVH
jgi:hypothetical protein